MKQGWELKTLGDVCQFQNGFAFKSKTFKDEGVPVLRISNIQKDSIDLRRIVFVDPSDYKEDLSKYVVNKGDLLIAMSGATTGKIGFNNTDDVFYLNQRVGKFKPSEQLNIHYLYYFLSTQVEENLKISAGSAQPNLSTQQIKYFKLPFPPLEEQKQIVAKLDQYFEAIDKAKANAAKNLENAKELFQSKLNDIFSQKGEGWVEKKLSDVCKYDKNKNQSNNLPYIGLEHIESNSGRFIGSLDSHQVKSSTFHFDSRHVLYGRLRPYLNKVLIPNFEGHCSTEIFPILVGNEIIREYLFYWLISDQTVKKIDATWTGARMPRANMNEVINFILPIPQVEEQKQIVKLLGNLREQTQSLESKYQQELNSLEELKKSILQKAFEGEL